MHVILNCHECEIFFFFVIFYSWKIQFVCLILHFGFSFGFISIESMAIPKWWSDKQKTTRSKTIPQYVYHVWSNEQWIISKEISFIDNVLESEKKQPNSNQIQTYFFRFKMEVEMNILEMGAFVGVGMFSFHLSFVLHKRCLNKHICKAYGMFLASVLWSNELKCVLYLSVKNVN